MMQGIKKNFKWHSNLYPLTIRENPITEHEQDAILKKYSENKVELLEIKYVIADVKIWWKIGR